MPQTKEEWIKVANDFNRKWNFPFCLGALGKHFNTSIQLYVYAYFFFQLQMVSTSLLKVKKSMDRICLITRDLTA